MLRPLVEAVCTAHVGVNQILEQYGQQQANLPPLPEVREKGWEGR